MSLRRFPVGRTRAGKLAGTVRSMRACRNHCWTDGAGANPEAGAEQPGGEQCSRPGFGHGLELVAALFSAVRTYRVPHVPNKRLAQSFCSEPLPDPATGSACRGSLACRGTGWLRVEGVHQEYQRIGLALDCFKCEESLPVTRYRIPRLRRRRVNTRGKQTRRRTVANSGPGLMRTAISQPSPDR